MGKFYRTDPYQTGVQAIVHIVPEMGVLRHEPGKNRWIGIPGKTFLLYLSLIPIPIIRTVL